MYRNSTYDRLSWIMELVAAGKVEIVDTKPETGIQSYCEWVEYPDEPGMEASSGLTVYDADNQTVVCASAWPGHGGDSEIEPKHLKFTSEEAFVEYCREEYDNSDFGHGSYYTQAGYEKMLAEREAEEQHKKLESMNAWVKDFCRKRSLQPMSIEFLDAVQDHLDGKRYEWERRIEGAQEDGLCIGMGVSPDEWYDHMDGLQIGRGRVLDFASDVMEWCENELPMFMAKWRESKAISA